MANYKVQRVSQGEREESSDHICVICREKTLLRLDEWWEKGKRKRRFHHEKAGKMFCCHGYCHVTCLRGWLQENARRVILFKCPHCRHLCCDDAEIRLFMEGQL